MTITTAIVTWGPAEAADALATMTRNRRLSPTKVKQYRNDMLAGRWQFAGESVQFDEEGHLLNGQHRLKALASLEGTAVRLQFLVVRGLPAESQMVMDQVRARQAGQQLQMREVRDANTVAAGVRLWLAYDTGLMFRDAKLAQETITTAYIEEWVLGHLDIVEALYQFLRDIKATDAPGSVAYAAALTFWQRNPAATAEFFRTFAKGAAGESSPITVLDKRLQRHRREGLKISNRDVLGLYVQAWNAWRRGQSLTKFQRPRGGHWTETTFPRAAA